MLIRLHILFVCYITILGALLPKAFGDISLAWSFFYLVMIAFLITVAVKLKLKVSNTWLFMLFFFSTVMIAAVSWTPFHSYDLQIIKRLFAHAFVPLFIAIVALNLFTKKRNVDLFIKHLSISAFLLSLVSIGQVAFGAFGGALKVTNEVRAAATFDNPNTLAIFLFLSIPSLLYGIEKQIISKKRAFILIPAIIVGVLSTASRKGVFGIAFASTIYFLLNRRFKHFFILVGVYAVLGLGVATYDVMSHRFEQKAMESQMIGRWRVVQLGLKMFYHNPLIGLGHNGYVNNSEKYYGRHLERSLDAHNVYITVLANYGLAGFLPFIGMLLYPLLVSRKILLGSDKFSDHEKGMAKICISTVIPFAVVGWFSGGLIENWQILNLLYSFIMFVLCSDSNKTTIGPTLLSKAR